MTNVVHRDTHLTIVSSQNALVVEWRVSTRIIDDTELLQGNLGGRRQLVTLVQTQMDGVATSCQMGDKRTHQYHHKRQVQQHNRHAPVQPLPHDVGKRSHRKHSP